MKILFVLVFSILLVLVGCSQVEKSDSLSSETKIPTVTTITPNPIPMPTIVLSELQNEIDERNIVIESLTLFNNSSNNYIKVLQSTNDIYGLQNSMLIPEESQYHIAFVASKVIASSLTVYENAILNWTLQEESQYYDKLMAIKEGELVRIKRFGALTELMLITLPTEDAESIKIIHDKFLAWRDDPLNFEPMILQHALLTELDIHSDEVSFMYVMPEKPLPTLPPVFGNDANQTVG